MKTLILCIVLSAGISQFTTARAAAQRAEPQQIAEFLRTAIPAAAGAVVPGQAAEPPRVSVARGGYVRYVGAPPGMHFPAPAAAAGPPELVARQFLLQRGNLFGVRSPAVDFTVTRNRKGNGRSHIRLQQLYRNIPVIAAEVVVQVTDQGGIESVLADVEPDTTELDANRISLTPKVVAEDAATAARNAMTAKAAAEPLETTAAQLSIFAPSVLDEPGPQQLVWDLTVFTPDRISVNERVLVNAGNGGIVRVWTLNHHALNRQISDATNTIFSAVRRTEGQAATGVADIDNAYTFIGDTYTFYNNVHNRDSYDGAGAQIMATVRWCANAGACPTNNAVSGNGAVGSPMLFGNGFTTDDIVAHEFTHKVTANESRLIYTNESGAINESLSDVWGEFVDLTNTGGNDSAGVRWLIGEDLPGGTIRSMSFPTNFSDPDRRFSSFYQDPSNTADNGGVHSNSGVNNKLCYLLTDGDTFNGQTISGLGIFQVVVLYYEAQANLLTEAAGWAQLYDALQQAAVNLNWSIADRNNLYRACAAVEITYDRALFVDGSSNCGVPTGLPSCVGPFGPYETVTQGVSGARPGDRLRIRSGNYPEAFSVNKILTIEAHDGVVRIGP